MSLLELLHTGCVATWTPTELDEVERSADPSAAALLLDRVATAHEGAVDRIASDGDLRAGLVAIAAASPWLGRLCVTDELAIEVLANLDQPVDLESVAGDDGYRIDRAKRLETLRIAARDLIGLDGLEAVGSNLASLAAEVLDISCHVAGVDEDLAVIGMGKLGGSELNYSSDVDVLLVGSSRQPDLGDVRRFLDLARRAWRVDLDLRPEGRAGSLVRTLESYAAYWDRWAESWEFQALLKSRAVAGNRKLGARFESEAAARIWERLLGSDDLRQVRHLKSRAEEAIDRRGLAARELKSGRGGIRDIEFSVQLVQLVHGRADADIRSPSTLPALRALAAGGYVDAGDAASLENAYIFLRTVEHRLQLEEDQQVHALPPAKQSRSRLARVLGYRDAPSRTALAEFEEDLRRHQLIVRAIHERLFFRPLLEAFASVPTRAAGTLPAEAIETRLKAFGFADAARTHQAIKELTRGFSRTSRLMNQMLPVLLDWLSGAPDPDQGLLGLRTLASSPHCRDQLTTLCRESPEAARQLCQLLGTGPRFTRDFQRHPELLGDLGSGELLSDRSRDELHTRARGMLAWRSGEIAVQQGLREFGRVEMLRIAVRDVLGLADVVVTGRSLSDLAEAVIQVAVEEAAPQIPFAVIGMGRLGGRELAYSSDLDLLFVYGNKPSEGLTGATPGSSDGAATAATAEGAATAIARMIEGSTPPSEIYRVDTALRPEGRQGPQARSVEAYAAYYERWAQAWERQALLRGRFVAGDRTVAAEFESLAKTFVWGRPFGVEDVRQIRRTKARVERERIPPSEDPEFHLKLGPGALADIEWTVQLLQLQHRVSSPGTMEALSLLVDKGAVSRDDGNVLMDAYRFCEQTRNRLGLIRDIPGESLPSAGHQLTTLARSFGTTATGLRDDYRRRTRRARRVVEKLFYGRGTEAAVPPSARADESGS
ncbi:MAG TPA: bifunctional [glutamine synthetase] adenylyltransferase/[glutamine synthetase]-adenylyl-L-tyrosine phosphorylase [Acidimicrobiales bacterium]